MHNSSWSVSSPQGSVWSPMPKCCRKYFIGTQPSTGEKPSDLRSKVILDMVDEVIPIEKKEVLRAGEITQNRASLSARDAVHIAVMERHGIRSILSFDADFDRWPGLQRIHRV